MSIDLDDLLVRVNKLTARQETDLSDYLQDIVHDLERESIWLEGQEEIALTTGTDNYTLSGRTYEYRKPIHIQVLDSSDNVYPEMEQISYAEYRDLLTSSRSNSRPYRFAIFDGVIYFDIPPSSTYDAFQIWGNINYGDTVTTITYDAKYRKMFLNGCSYYVFKRYGLQDTAKAKGCWQEYISEMAAFNVRKGNEKSHFVKYND